MKISRIYANKNFRNIVFNLSGLNVVVGKITNQDDNKKDTHNLGKSLLVEVIDFLLLKKISKKDDYFLTNGDFTGLDLYGEFALNNNEFLVVMRNVDSPTKISCVVNKSRLTDFQLNIMWDEENIPLEKAKEFINQCCNFSVVKDWKYRKSVNFFLRTQNDYHEVFKLSKFRGKDKDWKPFVFDLLGFPGTLLADKYQKEEERADFERKVQTLKTEASASIEDRDKLAGLLSIKKDEYSKSMAVINDFDFRSKDSAANDALVGEIDRRLQELNSQRYYLSLETSKIETSLNEQIGIVDIDRLKKIYADIQILLPNQVISEFSALIKFNKDICEERMAILQNNLSENQNELRKLEEEINALNDEKIEKLNYLTEHDSFKKIKMYQKELSQKEAEILMLEEKIELVNKSINFADKISDLEIKINEDKKSIQKEISTQKHNKIRIFFNSIIKEILNTTALISLKQNAQGNVEFKANIQNPNGESITQDDNGASYKKLLCIAFDMALLENYSHESFYRFAFHDGALEALDNRKKIAFLNVSRNICQAHNLQHIITLIDTDAPTDENHQPIHFNKGETVLELNDKDEKGLLFEKKF